MSRQKWGQHFLVNRGVVKKIIRQVPPHFPTYLEIGPGKGVLTRALAEHLQGGNIVTVEVDPLLGDQLSESFGDAIRLIRQSILDVSLKSLAEPLPIFLLGNIPYYLSSDLILWLARQNRQVAGGVLMVQKEFMEKIQLHPPTPRTLLFRMFFQPQHSFDVSPGSFLPPPKIHSSVFRFEAIPETSPIPPDEMDRFLKQCFFHRRKTLIKNLLPMGERNYLNTVLENFGISPQIRAEELSVDQFKKLFFMLSGESG